MIPVCCEYTGDRLIPQDVNYPLPGTYWSIITDARTTVISPFYKDHDLCYVVEYRLVNVETLETCYFVETYYPYGSNPRSDKFFSYIKKHLPFHEQDEEIIGTREKVEINWDVLGGYAYPVISKRSFIDMPPEYREEYCCKEDVED